MRTMTKNWAATNWGTKIWGPTIWGGLICLSLAGFGCSSDHDALLKQNQELQQQLTAARQQQTDPAQLGAMQQQISMRDAQIAKLQSDLASKPAAAPAAPMTMQPGMEGVETTYDPAAGTVTAAIPGDVLFDPGKATLKDSAKASLNKIIAALNKQYPGKALFIDGHTDTDPINRSRDQWEDNRDLSYFRAKAVSDYLTDNKIDPKQITIRAFGENNPKATKPSSRRVEIVVVAR